jgi:hypothetical protein
VLTTSGTYPWSSVTQIFHNSQPSHGGDRKTLVKMTEIVILFLILDLINWNLISPPVSGGVRVARSWLR